MASDLAAWRGLWRRRGLAVDKVFPKAFAVPGPSFDEVRQLVPKHVCLPAGSKERVQDSDVDVVFAFHTEVRSGFILP